MEFSAVFESLIPVGIVLLCVAGVAALVACAYFFVSMVKIIKETMHKVNPLLDDAKEITEAVKPAVDTLLDDVTEITSSVKPAVGKVDPLMDRATLTIDAVNLEIMRVDQVMEDVSTITGNLSKATSNIDAVSAVPFEFLANITDKVRNRINPYTTAEGGKSHIVDTIDSGLSAVGDKASELQANSEERKASRKAAVQERSASQKRAKETSSNLKNAVNTQVNTDADAVKSEE